MPIDSRYYWPEHKCGLRTEPSGSQKRLDYHPMKEHPGHELSRRVAEYRKSPRFELFLNCLRYAVEHRLGVMPLDDAWTQKPPEAAGPSPVKAYGALLQQLDLGKMTGDDSPSMPPVPDPGSSWSSEEQKQLAAAIKQPTEEAFGVGYEFHEKYSFFVPAWRLEGLLEAKFGEENPGKVIAEYLRAVFDRTVFDAPIDEDRQPPQKPLVALPQHKTLLQRIGGWAITNSTFPSRLAAELSSALVKFLLGQPSEFQGQKFCVFHPAYVAACVAGPQPIFNLGVARFLQEANAGFWSDNGPEPSELQVFRHIATLFEVPLSLGAEQYQPVPEMYGALGISNMPRLAVGDFVRLVRLFTGVTFFEGTPGVDELRADARPVVRRQIRELQRRVERELGSRSPIPPDSLYELASAATDIWGRWILPRRAWLLLLAATGPFESCSDNPLDLSQVTGASTDEEGYLFLADVMQEQGWLELASALLAFMLFETVCLDRGGLQLSWRKLSHSLHRALNHTSRAMLEKSIRVSADYFDNRGRKLEALGLRSFVEVGRRARHGDSDPVAELIPKVASRERILQDLKAEFGDALVARLSDKARQSWIDAEVLWACQYRELGRGLKDWGGLVMHYQKVFEIELINRFESALSHPTCRDYLGADRGRGARPYRPSVADVLRVLASYSSLPPPMAKVIDAVGTRFHEPQRRGLVEKLDQVRRWRNRGAHTGEIDAGKFTEVRGLLYERKLMREFLEALE